MRIIAALTLVLVLAGGTAPIAQAAGSERPNIVVLMVDDLGAIDERVLERLPAIRRFFLRTGIRFDNAYTETPLCCPARAAFLSGQHVANHGVDRNDARLFDPTNTLATALNEQGYFTAMAGKYFNMTRLLESKRPPGWNKVAIMDGGYYDNHWWVQGVSSQPGGYSTDILRDHALRYLKKAPAGKPVFLYLTPFAPHGDGLTADGPQPPVAHPRHDGSPLCADIQPWKPPNYEGTDPKGRSLVAECEALLAVDDLWRTVRKELASQGRLTNTLALFFSDNGMAYGAHGWPMKDVPYATRLPFYARWEAARGVQPRVEDGLVSNIDLAPTLAELAGASMPWVDGASFAQTLLDQPWERREDMLESHPNGNLGTTPAVMPWHAVRTTRWHYIEWDDGRVEMYDLQADPWEMEDLAGRPRYSTKQAALSARLAALRTN